MKVKVKICEGTKKEYHPNIIHWGEDCPLCAVIKKLGRLK